MTRAGRARVWLLAGGVLLGTAVVVAHAARPTLPEGAQVLAEVRAVAGAWQREAGKAKDPRRPSECQPPQLGCFHPRH